MSEIQSLTIRAQALSQSVDFWNTVMIWALIFAAIAAVAVVVTTRIAITRAKHLSNVQGGLIRAKDAQLAIELKDKDEKIADTNALAETAKAESSRNTLGVAQANLRVEEAKAESAIATKDAAEANVRAANANERTEELRRQNLELEKAVSPRMLEQGNFASALKPFSGVKAIIVAMPDFEARRLSGQLVFALKGMAGWEIESSRIANNSEADRIKEGIEVQYVSGPHRQDHSKPSSPEDFDFNAQLKDAAESLVKQLKAQEIEAVVNWVPTGFATANPQLQIPIDTIVISIGLKPNKYFLQKKLLEIKDSGETRLISENH